MKILNQNLGKVSRRDFLKTMLGGSLAFTGAAAGENLLASSKTTNPSGGKIMDQQQGDSHNNHSNTGTLGQVNHEANGFDPTAMLYDWDFGVVSELPDGSTLREFHIAAVDKELEVAPGVFFPAWTYNGRVPGPSLRCVEGDRVHITMLSNLLK